MLIQNPSARVFISLDGQWNIILDPYENGYYNHRYQELESGYFKNQKPATGSELIEYDFLSSQKLLVPGDWNTQDEQLFWYEGTVWYHKDFELEKQPNKRYLLYFGAVNYSAVVYVNGHKLGVHEGGFTPFQFEASEYLQNGPNFVVVKVDNRREREHVPTVNTDWWNYGGITRPVKLIEVAPTYLADYSVRYQPEGAITGWVQLIGENLTGQGVIVRVPALELTQTISVDEGGYGAFRFDEARPTLWTPENPTLYQVQFAYDGEEIEDRIGFRYIEVRGHEIFLNGVPIFLRGISIHEESPRGDGRAWSDDDARTLLGWAKELNCNFVRLAHYPHNEVMVRTADKMGLLVWSEIPVYWTILFDREEVYANAERQLSEMITRDKNRASIILWSVANETPNHESRLRFLQRLVLKARSLDDSRLVTAAMDTQTDSESGKVIDDPFAESVDVVGVNSYCGWYVHAPEECAKLKWTSATDKPIIMTELGAGALQGNFGDKHHRFTEEHQAFVYQNNIEMLEQMPQLRGVTPWILKDFRTPRRPLPQIQDFWNRKGLLSERGIKKKAWHLLKGWYDKKEQED